MTLKKLGIRGKYVTVSFLQQRCGKLPNILLCSSRANIWPRSRKEAWMQVFSRATNRPLHHAVESCPRGLPPRAVRIMGTLVGGLHAVVGPCRCSASTQQGHDLLLFWDTGSGSDARPMGHFCTVDGHRLPPRRACACGAGYPGCTVGARPPHGTDFFSFGMDTDFGAGMRPTGRHHQKATCRSGRQLAP